MSNFISTKVFAKISELDEAIQFDSLDEFVVVDNSVTKKITGQYLTDSIVNIGNLASKSYVDAVVDAVVNGAPVLLDTLNELAAALNNDENFATTITALIGTKLASNDFNTYFDTALTSKTTSDVAEDTNLYYTQARFDSALAAKTTSDVAEGSNLYWTLARFNAALATKTTSDLAEGDNLYFTEQRVLDIISAQPTYRLVNGSFEVTLDATGTLTLPAEPTSDGHAATKGYVDNQVDTVVAGQGFATLGYVEDAIGDALDNYKSDRLVSGSKEVILQSNGYIRLVNGAQLYDYGSGTGNGYGITDAANGTYIGYDPSDTLGALHMDSYTGGNIRIRTTTLPNTYKDWLFESNGALTLPTSPTSDSHAATKGYVDSQVNYVVAGQGFATLDYVGDAISSVIDTARTEISTEINTAIGTAIDTAGLDGGEF